MTQIIQSDDLVQIKIDTEPKRLLVVGDPIIVFTSRGYTPGLVVVERRTKKQYLLYIGAKSLSVQLERYRVANNDTLKGVEFWIRKKGHEKTAEYVVEE